jgi:biotin carboxylase
MKKKIAIIGASYLQVPLLLKAKEMGLETHCFAWEDGAVGKDIADFFYPISILEKDLILEKCQEIGIDGITTIATDLAVPSICYVAEKLKLISNSYAAALISTNKIEMRKAFSDAKCSSPKFLEVLWNEINIEDFSFPLIVKPSDRSGSRGVSKVDSKKELVKAIEYARNESLSNTVLIEEYIHGFEVSVESISWQGAHTILAVTDKETTGAPYFVELAHHQPSSLPSSILETIKAETVQCLDALNVKYGASHAEFKVTADGKVFVIEVGARMGGDFIGSNLVELSTGYDFLSGIINIAMNKYTKPTILNEKHSGVYFLSKERESLLPYFESHNDFEVQKEIQNRELKSLTNSNDRSGYLIYQANERVLI